MKRWALAGSLATMLMIGVSWAGAETVPLGFDQDTSSHPSVYFSPSDLERAESFQVLVTADPVQRFEYRQYISCRRGSESISLESPKQMVTPPFSTTILPSLPEPDSCWIDLWAVAPFDDDIPGTVRIEVTGNRRPPPPPAVPPGPASLPTPRWVFCAAPHWLKSGQTKAHGEGCGRSRVIATIAWRRPAKAGSVVSVRGYSCRRTQKSNSATVRCTKGQSIIKVTGQLR